MNKTDHIAQENFYDDIWNIMGSLEIFLIKPAGIGIIFSF